MSSFTDSRFFIRREYHSFMTVYKFHDLAAGEDFGESSINLEHAIDYLDAIRKSHGESRSDLFFLDDLYTFSSEDF